MHFYFQIIEHINTMQKLPSLAKSTLCPHSQEQVFFEKMANKKATSNRYANNCITSLLYIHVCLHISHSMKIDEYTSVIGSAQCALLLPSEKDLLGHNLSGDVMTYPKVLLANHRVISAETRSRATKRNNSCILYRTEQQYCYGVVQKIFVIQDSGKMKCFLLVNRLDPSPLEVCNDQVTNANLKKHYSAFCPPQWVY